MTADALAILQWLFSAVWALFTSWHLPGTHMTPAEWAFFVLSVFVLWRFIRRLGTGSSGGGGDD